MGRSKRPSQWERSHWLEDWDYSWGDGDDTVVEYLSSMCETSSSLLSNNTMCIFEMETSEFIATWQVKEYDSTDALVNCFVWVPTSKSDELEGHLCDPQVNPRCYFSWSQLLCESMTVLWLGPHTVAWSPWSAGHLLSRLLQAYGMMWSLSTCLSFSRPGQGKEKLLQIKFKHTRTADTKKANWLKIHYSGDPRDWRWGTLCLAKAAARKKDQGSKWTEAG